MLLERYKEWGFPQDPRTKIKYSIRLNPLRDNDTIHRLRKEGVKLAKVEFAENGFNYESRFPLASTIEYLLGQFYIQEASAQLPGEIISRDLKSKDVKILDMCAAPGGKTSQLSEVLENKGHIVALDIKKERVEKLCFNLERMHCTNVEVHTQDSKEITGEYDYVLLDAPCSGNYSSEMNWFARRKVSDFKNRQKLQKELLKTAAKVVKKGGIIIYSTCSLEKEEDEDVVEYGLKELGLELQDTKIDFGEKGLTKETEKCLRIWPTQHKYPGFFVAKLKKLS